MVLRICKIVAQYDISSTDLVKQALYGEELENTPYDVIIKYHEEKKYRLWRQAVKKKIKANQTQEEKKKSISRQEIKKRVWYKKFQYKWEKSKVIADDS